MDWKIFWKLRRENLLPTLLSIFAFLLVAIGILWFVLSPPKRQLPQEPVLIGRDITWYPVNLQGKEINMAGFSSELTAMIAKNGGTKITIVDVPSKKLWDDFDKELYDGIFAFITPNATNRSLYYLSESFYPIGPVLVVPESSPIQKIEEMKGKTIGVIEDFAINLKVFSRSDEVSIRTFDRYSVALDKLLRNQIDGLIIPSLTAFGQMQGIYAGKLRVIPHPLNRDGLRLITKKTKEGEILIDLFNQELEKLRQSGEFRTLILKWGLIPTSNEDVEKAES